MTSASLTRASIAGFARQLIDIALSYRNLACAERRFRVADSVLSLYCADPVIAPAYAARLGTSEEPAGEAADHRVIVVHAADIGWTSVPIWADERCVPQHFCRILADHGLLASYPFSPGIWQVYDREKRVGIQLTGNRSDLPPWDFGAPLRQFLHWLLPQHRLRLTHAAAVGRRGRGALLVGDGGAGKSATTLAAIASGLVAVGDDYVATGIKSDQPVARLLYRILKQDRPGLDRIPGLAAKTHCLPANWQGKLEIDPEALFPGCLASWLSLDAALVPNITRGQAASIVPISRGELMRTLMRTNLYQYSGEPDDGLTFFARLLKKIPCYRIDLALEPRRNGEAIARLLDQFSR